MLIDNKKTEELINQGYESNDLDYKEEFNKDSIGDWMELAKDVYGISNFGGGYIVIGVEDGTFKKKGLDVNFHLDSTEIKQKVSKWVTGNIRLEFIEHTKKIEGIDKKFGIICIEGSLGSLIIPNTNGDYVKADGRKKTAFVNNVVYIRKDSSTSPASGEDYWKIFWELEKRTAETLGSTGVPLEILSELKRKASPAKIEEVLWFNLFPVNEIPDNIYSATTDYRYPLEIYNIIKENRAFLLEDGKVYSFSKFDSSNSLTPCTNGIFFVEKTSDWLRDLVKQKKLIKLLNYNLKALCRSKNLYYDSRKDRYYVQYYVGGLVPEIKWKPYKSTSIRELVHFKYGKNGNLLWCEHFGARIKFIILAQIPYLLIEPIRVLTRDGKNPLDKNRNTRVSTAHNRFYHNNTYLYDMKLCLHILAGNREEILMGDNSAKVGVSVVSLNSKVAFGINGDVHTGGDFLDNLKSEPLDYIIHEDDSESDNPLTEDPIQE